MATLTVVSYARLAMVGLSMFVLYGCSTFSQDPVKCDQRVSAVELGARVSLLATETGEPLEVRLNGVSALCTNYDTEMHVDIKAGLKILRLNSDLSAVAELEVPFLAVAVSAQDIILERKSFGFKMAVSSKNRTIYPVVDFGITIPSDGRVIVSLIPEAIRTE